MKRITSLLTIAAASVALFASAHAAPQIGQAAPDFTLTDINGNKHSLSEFKGKTVVIEWVNPECPFVVKHYGSGNMPGTQKAAEADGAVWLSVNSAHPGAQGDYDKAQVDAWMKKTGATPTAYFRDQSGSVGKLYDARTTPHIFIVDPQGKLVYAGGIDDIASTKTEDLARANNYVKAALADLKAGKPVKTPTSKPYGCSVKYGN
jgi:peroxiredoxin